MRSRRAFLVAEATGTVTQLWPVFQKLSMETLHCEPVAPFVWKSLWLMDLFRSCWSSLPATCKRGVVLPNAMWVTLLYLGSGLLRYLRQWMPVCPLLHTLLQALVNELEKGLSSQLHACRHLSVCVFVHVFRNTHMHVCVCIPCVWE